LIAQRHGEGSQKSPHIARVPAIERTAEKTLAVVHEAQNWHPASNGVSE